METIIIDYLQKAGLSPTTAVLGGLLWMVQRQIKMLENVLTAMGTMQRDIASANENILDELKAIREGGGSLNKEQAIHIFHQMTDKYAMRMTAIANEMMAKSKSTSHQSMRNACVEAMHNEHSRFITSTRMFHYKNRALSEFTTSTARRWQYAIDDTVNRIYMKNNGDKAIDCDFEALFDFFRSRLQGSFRQWLDTSAMDDETFEREFAERHRMANGHIEYLRDHE